MADVKYQPSPEDLLAFDLWLEDRPPQIREAAKRCPPWNCYRLRGQSPRGHYIIYSYDEPQDGSPVQVTLDHGGDSHSPGIRVFGNTVDDLDPCGCGQWEAPTDQQMAKTRMKIQMLKMMRRRKRSGEHQC